jgi:hypothetical protein
VDARSEELFKDKLDARNFELSSKIKVSQKGSALYSERRKNVQSGTRQQIVHMFDHLRSIDCSKGAI